VPPTGPPSNGCVGCTEFGLKIGSDVSILLLPLPLSIFGNGDFRPGGVDIWGPLSEMAG